MHPVARIVSRILFQLLHARTEPLISIVVVVGDARAEHVEEGKAFVLDSLLDELGQVLLLAAEAASNKSGPGCQRDRDRIDRGLDAAKGHALSLHSKAAGGRCLPGGEAV